MLIGVIPINCSRKLSLSILYLPAVKKYYIIVTFLLLASLTSNAQNDDRLRRVLQFSGMVITDGSIGEPVPLPYTSISVMGTNRGTTADQDGFFSLVARTGDTIVFSRIGYKQVSISIPDTLQSDRYSWYQIMTRDSILLPEAIIYPWPSREHFKIELLALDISNELRSQAERNLAKDVIERAIHMVPTDGREAYSLEFAKSFDGYRYDGQFKPQNIFNIAAWKQFIQAWRRGDFKSKKKK